MEITLNETVNNTIGKWTLIQKEYGTTQQFNLDIIRDGDEYRAEFTIFEDGWNSFHQTFIGYFFELPNTNLYFKNSSQYYIESATLENLSLCEIIPEYINGPNNFRKILNRIS